MAVLLVHLSDAHLRTLNDPLMRRSAALAHVVASETDASVDSIFLTFTGDAIDRGYLPGFDVARAFLSDLITRIQGLAKIRPELFLIPGNHDVVGPEDSSLRDLAIEKLGGSASLDRPKGAIEQAIMEAMRPYFDFAATLASAHSPGTDNPYYICVDKPVSGGTIRLHLLNSSWMCRRGQGQGSLVYPINEIRPPEPPADMAYEIALLHHPFAWFKQPEIMRPLRGAIEEIADMILTGHEHVGRTTRVAQTGRSELEYREGEALQDVSSGQSSGFHVMYLDLECDKQRITTYRWDSERSGGSFVRAEGPFVEALGRNERRASLAHRLRPDFATKLDDPELPVSHAQAGTLRLSDFFVYPDISRLGEKVDDSPKRIRGENVIDEVLATPRILLLGADRSGKSSLAKRVYSDLHGRGFLPLLMKGVALNGLAGDKVARRFESLIKEQYEFQGPEEYWQAPPEKRCLIIDDLQYGPKAGEQRNAILGGLDAKFGRVIILGALEHFFDELFGDDKRDSGSPSILWEYEHFRILPFGYVKCSQFVRNWAGLDHGKEEDAIEEKTRELNSVLSQFLRTNAIPQYPWVVLVVVQQADAPESPHAQNGSYGHLLEALITAALDRSRIKLPINGRYRWLGELANELFTQELHVLTEPQARLLHRKYCDEYGVDSIDFSEIRDDLLSAGVLRIEGGDISFRQPYTYCYFVAWHLTQRINAGDPTAPYDVRSLCKNLYHEDTANVLVFLAHLTTSHVVLNEIISTAATLFQGIAETDFVRDVVSINKLYGEKQALALPPTNPSHNRQLVHDQQDERRAQNELCPQPDRFVTAREDPTGAKNRDNELRHFMEIATALRTIEILGQVLRNQATARRVPEQISIAEEIFKLGRRLLGFVFSRAEERLDEMAAALADYQSHIKPEAEQKRKIRAEKDKEKIGKEVNCKLFNRYVFTAFAVIKYVSTAVGERHLGEVFRQLFASDPNLANRLYKLAIDLELTNGNLPGGELKALKLELTGETKEAKGRARNYNNIAYTVLRLLVLDYLYLNRVSGRRVQALCTELEIKRLRSANDPSKKRLPPR